MDEEVSVSADQTANSEGFWLEAFALSWSPQVPTFSAPCSGSSRGSGTVSCLRRARGPAALHGVVGEDGGGGRRAHREAARQTVRRHPPENWQRLGETAF